MYVAVRNAMSKASRQLYKCEPPQHKKSMKKFFERLNEFKKGHNAYVPLVRFKNFNFLLLLNKRLYNSILILEVTYWKLEEIFQGYLHYEYDLYGACQWGSCPEMDNRNPVCYSRFCTHKQKHKRCHGYMRDCKSLSSKMSVCNAVS